MALYDDGGIGFAEEKFAESRKRNEEIAKEQEKFSKNLLGVEAVVKGASYLINQRADELESSFGPAKAKYKSYIQNAEATTTYWNEVQKNGGVDYLQKQIFDSYMASVKEVKPFEEVKNISSLIYDEATTKANELYTALESKAIQAKDVPTLQDFIDDYDNFTDIQAPRTLFGAATKGIKRILGRENAETLEYKKGIAKDKLFNTASIKNIDEFAKVAEAYDKLGYDTPELIRKIEKQYQKGLGKRIESTDTKQFSFSSSPGRTTTQFLNVIKYADGSASTEVILESTGLDTAATMTEVAETGLLMRIQPQFQDEFIKTLEKGGEGNALKSNISEAISLAARNNWFKVDVTNLNDSMTFINANYQAELQGKIDKKNNMPMVRMNDETREWEILPEYRSLAEKEGWDKPTYIQTQLDQLQTNYTVNQIGNGNIKTDSINTTSIESQITDPSKLEEFNSVIENPNSNVYKFTQSKIKDKTSGIIDITNGNPVDLNMFFPDIVSGKGIIKYNIDNNKYYVEGTEGELKPKFNVISLGSNNNNKGEGNIEFVLPSEEQIGKLANQPASIVRQNINKRNQLLEDLNDKENLSVIQIKSKENQIQKAEDIIDKNITRVPPDLSGTTFVRERGELKGIENLLSRPDRLSPNKKRELENRKKELENLIK